MGTMATKSDAFAQALIQACKESGETETMIEFTCPNCGGKASGQRMCCTGRHSGYCPGCKTYYVE